MSVSRSAMKFNKLVLSIGFACLAAMAGAPAHSEPNDAAPGDLTVGTELLALEDLRLARADIAKGAKLLVTKLSLREGQPTTVDVALSDGHVLKKVAISMIRTYFRVLADTSKAP